MSAVGTLQLYGMIDAADALGVQDKDSIIKKGKTLTLSFGVGLSAATTGVKATKTWSIPFAKGRKLNGLAVKIVSSLTTQAAGASKGRVNVVVKKGGVTVGSASGTIFNFDDANGTETIHYINVNLKGVEVSPGDILTLDVQFEVTTAVAANVVTVAVLTDPGTSGDEMIFEFLDA